MRGPQGVHAVSSRCPHLGLDLADGFYNEERLFCPGHGLVFEFATGESQCSEFRVRTFEVEERDGSVFLRRSGRRDATAPAETTAEATA